MTTQAFKFEKGFLNANDKKAIVKEVYPVLYHSSFDFKTKVIYHGKTRLEITKRSEYGYSVTKSVSGGNNYLYNSYFNFR